MAAILVEPPDSVDIAVIGGGPAGVAAARLLASWGHTVCLFARPIPRARALANSLPPSTRKLLQQADLLHLVERVGYRTYGNTVWWGARDNRVETFSADGSSFGHQVDRARLDPLLLQAARASGVTVVERGRVIDVQTDDEAAVVSHEHDAGVRRCRASLVLDASGRSGVLATRRGLRTHAPGGRMQALAGVWQNRQRAAAAAATTHTLIETCAEGWAWSIPTGDAVLHAGVMVDGLTSRMRRGGSLAETYRRHLQLTPRMAHHLAPASLVHVYASDASVYSSSAPAGDRYLLIGDAASTLNPLSSFGVKKALASAWLGAIAARTILVAPERAEAARAFFSTWERQVWQVNLQRSREFALEALARHPSRFWETQASSVVAAPDLPLDELALLSSDEVRASLDGLRSSDRIVFAPVAAATFVSVPRVRGNEIVIDAAVPLGPHPREALRFLQGIDLVALAQRAPTTTSVPALYERYCREQGAAPLPAFLGALALLVARGVLHISAESSMRAARSG